jgi:uncharacterized protein YbaR (Trm112 family)
MKRAFSRSLSNNGPVSKKLLSLLQCPITGQDLVYDKSRDILVTKNGKYGYPINKDGVPDLWPTSAIDLQSHDNEKTANKI